MLGHTYNYIVYTQNLLGGLNFKYFKSIVI